MMKLFVLNASQRGNLDLSFIVFRAISLAEALKPMATTEAYDLVRSNGVALLHNVNDTLRDLESGLIPQIQEKLASLAREQLRSLYEDSAESAHGFIEIHPASEPDETGEKVSEMAQSGGQASPEKRSLERLDPKPTSRKRHRTASGRDSDAASPSQASEEDGDKRRKKTVADSGDVERPSKRRRVDSIDPELRPQENQSTEPELAPSRKLLPAAEKACNTITDAQAREDNPDFRGSQSKKRRCDSADTQTAPRKRPRRSSGPLALPCPSLDAYKDKHDAQAEDEALQAAIAAQVLATERRENLEHSRETVAELYRQAATTLGQLKGQRWLLWYQLCVCTVVSSPKYPYEGAVRNRERRRKYEELRAVIAETQMLYDSCAHQMMGRAMRCLFE